MINMIKTYRYWFPLYPDDNQPIGGVKQIHRLAELLNKLKREATIIQKDSSFHPYWFKSNVKTISLKDFKERQDMNPERDIIVLPETWIQCLPTYALGFRKIIFNQNATYTLGGVHPKDNLPSPKEIISLYHHKDLSHVLCVSKYDEEFLLNGMNLQSGKISRLINGIEVNTFKYSYKKELSIAFMTRKNKPQAEIVSQLLIQQSWFRDEGWELRPIINMPLDEVAKTMQSSTIFISFGHPEGFGLPLAEAAASGCYLIGYSGLGGKEVMNLASEYGSAEEIEYQNYLGFVKACSKVSQALKKNPQSFLKSVFQTSEEIRSRYSINAMESSLKSSMTRWEESFTY